jgi:hypothetical protein
MCAICNNAYAPHALRKIYRANAYLVRYLCRGCFLAYRVSMEREGYKIVEDVVL